MFSFSELHVRQGAGEASLPCSWLIAIRFRNQEAGSEVARFISSSAAGILTLKTKKMRSGRTSIRKHHSRDEAHFFPWPRQKFPCMSSGNFVQKGP